MATPIAVPARETIEQAIELLEGHWTVEGRYYANEDDAARQRRIVAVRIRNNLLRGITPRHAALALEVRRLAMEGQTMCAWCEKPFLATDGVIPLGGRLVHADPCAREYDAFTSYSPRYEITDAGRAALAEGHIA